MYILNIHMIKELCLGITQHACALNNTLNTGMSSIIIQKFLKTS